MYPRFLLEFLEELSGGKISAISDLRREARELGDAERARERVVKRYASA
jgi:hypothetical protein